MEKKCPRCTEVKDSSEFSKRVSAVDGLQGHCKLCYAIIRAKERAELKNKIFNKLGHVCSTCGFSDKRALQFDHVNSDGRIDRVLNKITFYKKILADVSGSYQILCANCNWIKRVEKKEQKLVSI